MDIDHYAVLGLSSEKGSELSQQEIIRAYRSKAKELHPDKRHNNDKDDAHGDFIKLKDSFEILNDEESRNLFDARLRSERDSKHQKKNFHENYVGMRSEDGEISHWENFARFCARPRSPPTVDKSKVIRVSWVKNSSIEKYIEKRLKLIFGEFGEVEDVAIFNNSFDSEMKGGMALILMASNDSAVAAAKNFYTSDMSVIPFNMIYGADKHQSEVLLNELNTALLIREGYQVYRFDD